LQNNLVELPVPEEVIFQEIFSEIHMFTQISIMPAFTCEMLAAPSVN